LYQNGSIRAGFLTAIAANTAVVVVPGWLGLITFIPINGLRSDRTHLNADTAKVTPGFINNRPLGNSVLDEGTESPAGAMGWRHSFYFKAGVEKGIYISAYQFNILSVVCSQSGGFTRLAGGYDGGIKVNNSTGCGIQGYGVAGE
jgi:hypothetical protein